MVWTKLNPPTSLMAAIPDESIDAAAKASGLWARYAEEVDRESARERLEAKVAAATESAPAEAKAEPESERRGMPRSEPKQSEQRGMRKDDNAVVDYLKSREGRTMMNTVVRGVFGMLKKRR